MIGPTRSSKTCQGHGRTSSQQVWFVGILLDMTIPSEVSIVHNIARARWLTWGSETKVGSGVTNRPSYISKTAGCKEFRNALKH